MCILRMAVPLILQAGNATLSENWDIGPIAVAGPGTNALISRPPPCLASHPRLLHGPDHGGTKPRFGAWRGGRVVECTALEMRHRCKPIGGSNPSLSASKQRKCQQASFAIKPGCSKLNGKIDKRLHIAPVPQERPAGIVYVYGLPKSRHSATCACWRAHLADSTGASTEPSWSPFASEAGSSAYRVLVSARPATRKQDLLHLPILRLAASGSIVSQRID